MTIKKADLSDAAAANSLAHMLFGGHDENELLEETKQMIESENAAVFLAESGGEYVGIAECALRHDYVEGTSSSPVGYLEGIFVLECARRSGVARALLEAAKAWSSSCGASEFASDCELHNETSVRFHNSVGFTEAARIVCFTQKL
ncbi:MAG: GNAT family N-acetyltransferase [Eubacteriales bacterium]|nr:GNAT family N-acetyltransferase [Eubacteriales bacterium]MDD3880943.1 GNAT family N-acetyltransferase [Eubacteriales bacterium]MDD4511987.1 GNAT family N-acetyltransferase [Eubacteriales bacterium]